MKFDPIPRKNIFGEGCFIKSPENLLYFTEEFELAGVNWGAPAGISAPYFLRLLQEGKNARARKNELEEDPIFNPNPHSMDEFWYSLFDHGNMWRQRSGSIVCTGQPYGNWKMITDSFRNMKEKFGYPDSIKMCPLGDRYRFRPNGDFMLLFYCDRANGLYLPETVTHLYSGVF